VTDAIPDRLASALAAIDVANAQDPYLIDVGAGPEPKELVHARMMTHWVTTLDPDAGELQLVAARAHHYRRWTTPRADYPEGRAGYLRWRTAARRRHASEVGELLAGHGYGPAEVDRVGAIIRKEGLASDPAVQTHEDALCLVFLQTQLTSVAGQLGHDATVEVLAKSIRKMSPSGRTAAGRLELDPTSAALLGEAAARVSADEAPGS
jgi:hypothetical protein